MAKQEKTNLSQLQLAAENAARTLKTAKTTHSNAVAALARAEEAYTVAQKTFQSGVDQVKNATKVV